MTISLKKRSLSKPKRGEKVELFDIAFVRARNRNKAHSALLEEFVRSEISKAELAEMLGKRPEQITRWLAGPGNLTLDTLSDLFFALRGTFLELQCKDELSLGKSNSRSPEWLTYTYVKGAIISNSSPKPTTFVNRRESTHNSNSSEDTGSNYVRYTTRSTTADIRSQH